MNDKWESLKKYFDELHECIILYDYSGTYVLEQIEDKMKELEEK
jgi:hypothetical protein